MDVKSAAIGDHTWRIKNDHKSWDSVQLGRQTLPSESENTAWNPRVLQSVGWKPFWEEQDGQEMV